MTGSLLWTGIAIAAALGLLALWAWLWPRRISLHVEVRQAWADEIGDPTRAQIDQALDVIAEPDHRRAEHMNRTLRRVEGGDET